MDKTDFLKSLVDFTLDLIRANHANVSGEELDEVITEVYSKSLQDWAIENSLLKAEAAQAEITRVLTKHFQDVLEEEMGIKKALPEINEVLTIHPLHQLAHELDLSGEGFEWNKCEGFDLEFVPKEVINEVNRRHGQNWYPHFHSFDTNKPENQLFYEKAAHNLLQTEFSELHEYAHRRDYSIYEKGEDGIGTNLGEHDGWLNSAGGELSPQLRSHLSNSHGINYNNHYMEVPIIKSYTTQSIQEAAGGKEWDYRKGIKDTVRAMGHSVGNRIATTGKVAELAPLASIAVPAAAPILATVGVAGALAHAGGDAIARATEPKPKNSEHIKSNKSYSDEEIEEIADELMNDPEFMDEFDKGFTGISPELGKTLLKVGGGLAAGAAVGGAMGHSAGAKKRKKAEFQEGYEEGKAAPRTRISKSEGEEMKPRSISEVLGETSKRGEVYTSLEARKLNSFEELGNVIKGFIKCGNGSNPDKSPSKETPEEAKKDLEENKPRLKKEAKEVVEKLPKSKE